MAKMPPPAQLPSVVEAELGVREYWYETFRRVLVVPDGGDCYVVSVDVYTLNPETGEVLDALDAGPVKVVYTRLSKEHLKLGGVEPLVAEAVVLETGERRELVNVRLRYCGLRATPGYEETRSLYRRITMLLEGRDPEAQPLSPPEPVPRVYSARGLLRGRRAPRSH